MNPLKIQEILEGLANPYFIGQHQFVLIAESKKVFNTNNNVAIKQFTMDVEAVIKLKATSKHLIVFCFNISCATHIAKLEGSFPFQAFRFVNGKYHAFTETDKQDILNHDKFVKNLINNM